MAEDMTIGRLAQTTGIPASTIRFYEEEGLLRPAARSSGNYRIYQRDAAERLTFVGAAQAAGFELDEINAILALETDRVTCARANRLVSERLVALRGQMLKLRQLERVLQKIQRGCVGQPDDAPCVVKDAFVLRRWLRRSGRGDELNVERSFRLMADCHHGTENDHRPLGEVCRSTRLHDSVLRAAGPSPTDGKKGNYRYYGTDVGERLSFIRSAQAAGFELADIKSMLAFQDGRVAAFARDSQERRTGVLERWTRLSISSCHIHDAHD